MFFKRSIIVLLLSLSLSTQSTHSLPDNGKLRLCVVESRGIYRKAAKFCPILEATSNMECVVGVDRLDCIRRIHKGTADFGVLSSEDLIAARWSSVEILVTSELRSHYAPFEYEVVAVVDNEADIHTVHDLRGAKLCHPGYKLESHWTEVLANYFESTLIAKSCDPELSLIEDQIRAASRYFGPSCKAGPWVPNKEQDMELKRRYPSLCQMCYDSCDVGDKHWGRRGALYCLTSGGGSVAWGRLDDVRSHFGLSGLPEQAKASEYSFLCADGHLQPINSTTPCVWVAKPWPVVAARRSHAAQIQKLVSGISHDDLDGWQNALLSLLETYHVDIVPLDNVITIDDYLDQAPAFQGAYSFPECNPPRAVVYCTTSIVEHIKCSWLQEAAQVYGVQPNIQCIRSASLDTCMDDVRFKAADVVMVNQDQRVMAQRQHDLTPILYQFASSMHGRYTVIAVVHKDSAVRTFEDLRGLKVCLPSYEGAAHLSVLETIANRTQKITDVINFFHRDSCTWHPHAKRSCPDEYRGDEGALRCLAEGGDVAFLSSDIYKRYSGGNLTSGWIRDNKHKSFKVFCPYGNNERGSKFEYCYMHWTARGHLMTHNTASRTRFNETYNALRHIDNLFGKHYHTETRTFTMYGVFDRRNDIMFHDSTEELRGRQDLQKDYSKRTLEDVFDKYVAKYYEDFSSNSAASQQFLAVELLYFKLAVIVYLLKFLWQ